MPLPAGEPRCLSCGYILRGLSQSICPECGRAFDPADPKTFESRPPEWRRRRRIRRAIAVVVVVLALFPFFPRKLLKGEITFQCGACGAKQSMYRWEPMLPGWSGIRMPGVHWRGGYRRAPDDTRADCAKHSFDDIAVNVQFQFGLAKVSGNRAPDENVDFMMDAVSPLGNLIPDGLIVTPETTVDVLRYLMAPGVSGIQISFSPKEN